jgi:4'-phosphopantetheinyl transferase
LDASRLVEVRYLKLPDAVPADRLASWTAVLSADERRRAERFVRDTDRVCYVASHALLRLSLSRRADVPPERWTFRTGRHGKPEIAGDHGSDLAMSLSHTRSFAVCAVSGAGHVGVDVEHARRKAPLRVSESFFAPAEREAMAALADADRAGRFFEYWTLKEALLKAIGLGLTYPMARLSFELEGGSPRIHLPEDLGEASEDWCFQSWLVGGEFRISLAARTGPGVRRVTIEDASLCPATRPF